jgi:MerR family transcriptional regulator, light-induced transcriptional regulator
MESAGHVRIGELSRRSGVSPELLRAWEQRYGLLRPLRSEGGFRLYSPEDEQRIAVMRSHLGRGLSAAEAARLTLAEQDVTAPHAETPALERGAAG